MINPKDIETVVLPTSNNPEQETMVAKVLHRTHYNKLEAESLLSPKEAKALIAKRAKQELWHKMYGDLQQRLFSLMRQLSAGYRNASTYRIEVDHRFELELREIISSLDYGYNPSRTIVFQANRAGSAFDAEVMDAVRYVRSGDTFVREQG